MNVPGMVSHVLEESSSTLIDEEGQKKFLNRRDGSDDRKFRASKVVVPALSGVGVGALEWTWRQDIKFMYGQS
jgi:hypothetical protein